MEEGNRKGKAILCRRNVFDRAKGKRDEFGLPGVYLLFAQDKTEGDHLYIGEGDPILGRLQEHQSKKDFWTDLFCFTAAGSLNKSLIQYLECRLIGLAKKANRVKLENSVTPSEPTLSEAESKIAETFLGHILDFLSTIRIGFFKTSETTASSEPFYLTGRGSKAEGMEVADGFLVKKDSVIAPDYTPSYKLQCILLRQELREKRVLEEVEGQIVFTQDYLFAKPSLAATIVYGNSANGLTAWKTADGTTLKDFREKKAAGAASNYPPPR